jgi:hypothetical protein
MNFMRALGSAAVKQLATASNSRTATAPHSAVRECQSECSPQNRMLFFLQFGLRFIIAV